MEYPWFLRPSSKNHFFMEKEEVTNMTYQELCKIHYQEFVEECQRISTPEVKFCVLQCEDSFNIPTIIQQINRFYDENWLGNADYMHIPAIQTIINNYKHYPIFLAYQEHEEGVDILGILTLKYFENNSSFTNPYYPIPGKRHFEITGALTKKESPIRNVGKALYKIAIMGLTKMQDHLPAFDLIFVVDGRNNMSMNAARGACRHIRQTEDIPTTSNFVGVYTVSQNQQLTEFPTFVVKFHLNEPSTNNTTLTLDYQPSDDLFPNMLDLILSRLTIGHTTTNPDDDLTVTYYELENDGINLENLTVNPNHTDEGNDRTPLRRTRIRIGVNHE